MFEELVNRYKELPLSDKRDVNISELKKIVAIFDKLCLDNNISYRKINSNEILDLNKATVTEDDYLEAQFVYISYMKEVLWSYMAEKDI